jgi:hypothetical protein
MGNMRNVYKIWGTPEDKRPSEIPRHRLEDNIKTEIGICRI